ncbi:hypothetical protein R3P38DRAFT_665525 [Favolaschia claudopus]|uniref:F-box domain-containing protein n=1 Tax=Favolaschia claudopus TaxID=2862362 RepID=A0AAW0E7Y7_9AGAR
MTVRLFKWARDRRKRNIPFISQPRHIAIPLPIELWDLVFLSLPNDELLKVALISRAWNQLSIPIYLRRHGLAAPYESLDIPCFILQALHLSSVTIDIRALRCTFPVYDVLRRMRSLRAVVAKSPNLTSLSVEWTYDLLKAQYGDTHKQYTYVSLLFDILRTVVDRNPVPVIVIANGAIARYKREEIPGSSSPHFMRRQSFIKRQSSGTFQFPLGVHDESIFSVNSVHRLEVRSIRTGGTGELACFTLILFPDGWLSLRPSERISAADIAEILPHLKLPFLYNLIVGKDVLDPLAVDGFRERHSQNITVEYEND